VQSGELSRLVGISTDTLRHYERLGVLPKPPRTNGGYRDYPANSLDRVRLIQSALKVGFSLPELASILRMRDRGEVPCQRVRAIAEHKLQDVNEHINQLLGMRGRLERILKDWDGRLSRTEKGKPARLLESLPHDAGSNNPSRFMAKHMRRRPR
jgi:DNA-binding transcriptional MerR regulator